MNFDVPFKRIEPTGVALIETVAATTFAGDKFNDAIVDGSMWWWNVAGATDSLLLLLAEDELTFDAAGSRIKDFLKNYIF